MFAVRAKTILSPCRVLRKAYVIVDENRIVRISEEKPKNTKEIHNYDDCFLLPGLIDIHMHGGFGVDVTYSSTKEILNLSRNLPVTGVTSYMPSIVTDSFGQIRKALRNIVDAAKRLNKGSKILGIHLEGPYLNPIKGGAQPREHMRNPSLEEFKEFYDASEKMLKRITVAPEVKGGIEFIKNVTKRFKVKVSLGHTDATYDQALEAFKAGATIITHLYNGMRGYHHREPGIVGAALTEDKVYAEVIADLVHLHPATLIITKRCKGPNKMILVTDSISGAALSDGVYKLGSQTITIKEGVARLKNGSLAGSTLTMIRAIRNIVKIGVSLEDAVRMATLTPSRAIGVKSIGKIAEGYRADFTILNEKLEVVETYIDGKPMLEEIL